MQATTNGKRETKKAAAERERAESVQRLRELLPPGSKVLTVLRHVSASGMQREIDFYHARPGSDDGHGGVDFWYLTTLIGRALGYRMGKRGLIVGGCGMDVGYHVVNSLSYALHGMADVGAEAQEAGKAGRSFAPTATEYRSGYSLRHDWI